jgi:RNA polymerase sigma-70 factor (ECF subfamily)
MTGNATEAEDLTQETFLAAFQCRETYRGNAQPLAWLLGIARRRWRDCNRARRLEQVALSEDLLYETDVASQVIRANHLECSLAQLEPLAREAVVLVLGHGLTYVEAAEILEQPVGTVKWKVHCATRQLRQTLMEDERL